MIAGPAFSPIRKRHPRDRNALLFLFLAGTLALVSCGPGRSDYVYKLYPGPERPDSELATLQFGESVFGLTVDGLEVSAMDYGLVKLMPGEHRIRWGTTFVVSVMVNASGFDSAEMDVSVDMKAGRSYVVEADRTTGHGYTMYLWVEDSATGEVVGGTKKP